jgi:hypothetical protein
LFEFERRLAQWRGTNGSHVDDELALVRVTQLQLRTSARLALRASGEKRGTVLRKSPLSKEVFSSIFPVR